MVHFICLVNFSNFFFFKLSFWLAALFIRFVISREFLSPKPKNGVHSQLPNESLSDFLFCFCCWDSQSRDSECTFWCQAVIYQYLHSAAFIFFPTLARVPYFWVTLRQGFVRWASLSVRLCEQGTKLTHILSTVCISPDSCFSILKRPGSVQFGILFISFSPFFFPLY